MPQGSLEKLPWASMAIWENCSLLRPRSPSTSAAVSYTHLNRVNLALAQCLNSLKALAVTFYRGSVSFQVRYIDIACGSQLHAYDYTCLLYTSRCV